MTAAQCSSLSPQTFVGILPHCVTSIEQPSGQPFRLFDVVNVQYVLGLGGVVVSKGQIEVDSTLAQDLPWINRFCSRLVRCFAACCGIQAFEQFCSRWKKPLDRSFSWLCKLSKAATFLLLMSRIKQCKIGTGAHCR